MKRVTKLNYCTSFHNCDYKSVATQKTWRVKGVTVVFL